MKIGDKLICIEEMETLYLKDKIYYVIDIGSVRINGVSLVDKIYFSMYKGREYAEIIYVTSETGQIYGFHVVDNSYELSFNNYFINIKEERKLKLLKINK
jgi:hypothetical protein